MEDRSRFRILIGRVAVRLRTPSLLLASADGWVISGGLARPVGRFHPHGFVVQGAGAVARVPMLVYAMLA